MYRWGCAGRNNVYLLGHAHSVFKPLHDAYVSKRLRKGMTVDYADGNGRVRTLRDRLVEGHAADDVGVLGVGGPVAPEHDAPDVRRREQRVPPHGQAGRDRLIEPPGTPRDAQCLFTRRRTGPMIAGMAGTLSSPLIVGRATELAALDDALRRAVEGAPTVVLVGGEAGLGKTRLVTEFAAAARSGGARVLTGACLDLDGEGLPYGPFLEALRELGLELPPKELRALLGDVAPELVAVAPGYARFLGSDEEAADDGSDAAAIAAAAAVGTATLGSPADQNRLFELTLALIDRLAADRPLILVLEDLHWSDPASTDLLVFLVRTLRRGRVVLIGTFRTDDRADDDALLAQTGRAHPATERATDRASTAGSRPAARDARRDLRPPAGAGGRAADPRAIRGQSLLRRGAGGRPRGR